MYRFHPQQQFADALALFPDLLCCPVCQSSLTLTESGNLNCRCRHHFDISKQGYVNFLSRPVSAKYGKALFEARRAVMGGGFFGQLDTYIAGLISALSPLVCPEHHPDGHAVKLLDAGCGEGSDLAAILTMAASRTGRQFFGMGLDIAKEGILMAAKRHTSHTLWCVADLAGCPFSDGAFPFVLNILSPANYAEFRRLLARNGRLIKVFAGKAYLRELRELLFPGAGSQTMREDEPQALFERHFTVEERSRLQYSFVFRQPLLSSLLQMTPLAWNANKQRLKEVAALESLEVSVDLTVLAGVTKK